jgi:transketolase
MEYEVSTTEISTINEIKKIANDIRIDLVNVGHAVGKERKAHIGPALSATDIVATLFFHTMRLKNDDPDWEDRDRFILSKGHSCPVLYSVLKQKGYISEEDFYSLRHIGSRIQGHPDMRKTPGVDMTAGSLGHGLSAGAGIACSAKISKKDYKCYVMVGDGEIQEGLIWEAVIFAGAKKLNNLVAIVDNNGWQSCGSNESICDMRPIGPKWEVFGWNVIEIDGHDIGQIIDAFKKADAEKGKPTVIVAHTIKGKGVSFMENDNSWHQRALTDEEHSKAILELEEVTL